MQIDAAKPGQVDQPLGKNVPVCHHHNDIRTVTRKEFQHIGLFQLRWLIDLDARAQGRFLHRWSFYFVPSPAGFVLIGYNQVDSKVLSDESLECGYSEIGGSEKDEVHRVRERLKGKG